MMMKYSFDERHDEDITIKEGNKKIMP